MLHIFITFGTSRTGSLRFPKRESDRFFFLAATEDEDERSWHLEQIFGLSGVFVPHQGTASHTHLHVLLSRPIITKHSQRIHEMNFRWQIHNFTPFGLDYNANNREILVYFLLNRVKTISLVKWQSCLMQQKCQIFAVSSCEDLMFVFAVVCLYFK